MTSQKIFLDGVRYLSSSWSVARWKHWAKEGGLKFRKAFESRDYVYYALIYSCIEPDLVRVKK